MSDAEFFCALFAHHDNHADAALTHHLLFTYFTSVSFYILSKKIVFNEQFVTL